MTDLFSSLKLGDITLPNRIIMAPLTRARAANAGRIPNDLMAHYYSQRASAGLILTEATCINPLGVGYANTPGIWSNEQVEGWKKVTKGVHDRGGKIFVQLWHVGRISDPELLGGQLPVAPSAVKPKGHVSLLQPQRAYVTPRALLLQEIPGIVADYKKAAENAKLAGFDGVEIHSANGYLLDQFLQDGTNKRTDQYGGPIENRARLLLEVVDSVISVFGAGRVGVHLAPRGDSHDMHDSNRLATFGYVAQELGKKKIAFIFTRESLGIDSMSSEIKNRFGGVLIANEKMTREQAEKLLAEGKADAVSWGVLFIANPDLVERFAKNAPLNNPNPATFYADGETGYTDYPFLS